MDIQVQGDLEPLLGFRAIRTFNYKTERLDPPNKKGLAG